MILKTARKLVVGIVGGTVLLLGVIMLVTPGPAFIVIPAGLAILATEFVFAATLLKKMKRKALELVARTGAVSAPPSASTTDPPRPPDPPGG